MSLSKKKVAGLPWCKVALIKNILVFLLRSWDKETEAKAPGILL